MTATSTTRTTDADEGRHVAPATPTGPGARHVVGLVVGVTVVLLLLLVAFAWPATRIAPRELPLAVAAPQQVAAGLQQGLAQRAGADAFDVTLVADRAAAQQAIEDRDVYGAVVVGPDGGEMLTASAASPAVAALLAQVAAAVPAQAGGPLTVTDVVPLPADDPRGAGLASMLLPLALGGIASGAAASVALRGRRRVVAVLGVAVLGGLGGAAVAGPWLGVLDGAFWPVAGTVALGVSAIGLTVVGLAGLVGQAGIGIGAGIVMLVGNPFSGVTSAPELLPAPWGTIGQVLPPGAAGSLLRSVGYFDGAGSTTPTVVLGAWALIGLLLALLPSRASRAAR